MTWVTRARERPSRAAILALVSRVPDRNPACVDAICREVAARILRVRRAENDYRRGHRTRNLSDVGLGLGRGVCAFGVYRNGVRTGILALYSAESLS